MRWCSGILAGFLVVGLSSTTTFASEEEGASIALLAGYGQSNKPNLLGFGAGFRAGNRLDSGLYLGVLGLAHLGTNDLIGRRHHAQSVRGEIGYEFDAGELFWRPTFRAGGALVKAWYDLLVAPDIGLGLTVLRRYDDWLVGIDAEGRVFARPMGSGDLKSFFGALGGYLTFGRQF
jgi:hypothetical protein